MTVQSNSSYLSVKGVAETLGISERKVWDLIHAHTNPIPHFYIGRKIVRVRASELHQWMDDRRADGSRVDRLVDDILGPRACKGQNVRAGAGKCARS